MIRFINTTTKALIWLLMIEGTIWITWSYVLASLGHEQIAESLSATVCQYVKGGLITYVISAAVANIFKYNDGGIFGQSRPENGGDINGTADY